MSVLKDIQQLAVKKVPAIRPGNTVRVHQKIKEGEKERIQIFEGLVIKMNSGYGADKTFTVRKTVGGIGVEKIFPLYSTNIVKIEIRKKSKIRRAKLYYMRERSGKSARLKETFVSEKEVEDSIEELAEKKAEEENKVEEEPKAEEKPKATEETKAEEKAEAQDQPEAQEEPKAEEKPKAPEAEESSKE